MNYWNHEERKRVNEEHLNEPKVGDYWNEMLAPVGGR
jgi:hypothetical protein